MITAGPPAPTAGAAGPPSPPAPVHAPAARRGSWIAGGLGFLLVQLWFRPGRFLAAGDIPPFQTEGLRAELFNLWNHQSTGDGASGYVIARWPEVLISTMVRGVGLEGPMAQRVFLGGCVALCAATAAWATSAVVRRQGYVVVSSLLVVLSPLSITSLPSQLTFVASAAMALGLGLGLRTWQGRSLPWWPWVALAVTSGYLTINPPLLVVTVAWAAACLAGGVALSPRPGRKATLLRLLPGIGAAAALSAYWIVPFALTILRPSESSSFVAQTDVSQWAWTHARASILNVVSLTGHWSWDHPEYHAIVTVLDRPPMSWARYGLPLTAVSAPLLVSDRRHRRLSLVLLAAAAVLVFVGKGLHGPLGGANRQLYDNLPGFWLLREPVPKVGPALLPILVLLWALGLDGLAERARRPGWAQQLLAPFVAAAISLPVVFGWPLIDGRALEQAPGETIRVAVPEEWAIAAAAVDAAPSTGKAVQLPLADYYQLPTTWGYYGADTALSGAARRPVLTRSPGGYFSSRSVADRLLGQVERGVLEGDAPRVEEAMRRLGASVLVVRSDLKEDSPNRSFTPSAPLVAGLARLPGARPLHDGPLVHVVEMPSVGLAATYGAVQRGSDPGLTMQPEVAGLATNAPGLGRDGDELEGGVAVHGSADGLDVRTREAGRHAIKLASGLPLSFAVEQRGDRSVLVPGSRLEVDGAPKNLLAETDLGRSSDLRALRVGERVIVPRGRPGPVQIASGATLATLEAGAPPQRLPDGPALDCARTDDRTPAEVGIAVEVRPDGDLLSAREHRACLQFGLGVPPGAAALQLVVLGRSGAGPPAPPCVLVDLSVSCAPLGDEELLVDGSRRLTVALPAGAASLALFQYADPGNPVLWRRPTIQWLTAASTITLPDAQAAVDLAPGVHRISVSGSGGSQLGERSGISNCGGPASPSEAGMSLEEHAPDGFTLRTAQQRACTTIPVTNLGEKVAVHFEVRGDHAAAGGYCLWWDVLRTCGKTDSFDVGDGWRAVDFQVEVPPGVNEGRLFLYASPRLAGEGSVTYRALAVRDPRSVSLTFGLITDRPRPPVATPPLVRRHGGGASVEVPARPTPVLVRFAEGYSSRWVGTVDGRTVPHAQVDGFANGWVVPASDRPTTLEIRYGPQQLADLALAASVLAFLALLALVAGRLVRPRLRRPAPGGADGPESGRPGRPAQDPSVHSSTARASVAVVIPAFNEAATIERLVRAVLAEPWVDRISLVSVLVVDDNSDDGTGPLVDRLASELPALQVLRHPARCGKNAGIRTGLAQARASNADVLVVLDADIGLRTGAVVRTVDLLLARPDLGGTSCVNEPSPPRSWRERPSVFQARMLAELARTGAGPLQRLFALRLALLDGMELPDSTHDDVYLSRWLHRAGQGTASAPTAVIDVRSATGLRDFAKQTLRTRQAVKALDKVLPPAAKSVATRALRPKDVARAIQGEPVGAAVYACWLVLVLATPRRWWLPSLDHTKYDQSASTKALY